MTSNRRLELILERTGATEHSLWACRGTGKGCRRNSYREKKKHCDECMGPLPDTMTIGEVHDRINKGDA